MPRGYLKHNKNINRKKSRGGTGHSCKKRCSLCSPRQRPSNKTPVDADTDDFTISRSVEQPPASSPINNTSNRSNVSYPIGDCPICFESGPVIRLSEKCGWHESACYQCLRRIHVIDAQKSLKNFPLQCFHPQCEQRVQFSQLVKHGLILTETEVTKHHAMVIFSKIQKTDGARTVHCPHCEFPRFVNRKWLEKGVDRKLKCNNCSGAYRVSPDYATIRALERMGEDSIGVNDGCARCPECGVLISKGNGCDHMTCGYCDYDFSWDEAVKKFGSIARPPDDEIHLWW